MKIGVIRKLGLVCLNVSNQEFSLFPAERVHTHSHTHTHTHTRTLEEKLISRDTDLHLRIFFGMRASCSTPATEL
jgi:hypothetical protein